jgi:hypothetical protein
MESTLANKIFSDKYSAEMSIHDYDSYLRNGLKLINNGGIQNCKELKDLKSIRIALEYNRYISLSSGQSNKGIYDSYVESLATSETIDNAD